MKTDRVKDKTSILTCQRFSTSQLSNQTDKLRCRSSFAHYNTIERHITLMRAYLKTSLTILGPSPRYFCTNSDPTTLVGGVYMITTWWQNQRRGRLRFYCTIYVYPSVCLCFPSVSVLQRIGDKKVSEQQERENRKKQEDRQGGQVEEEREIRRKTLQVLLSWVFLC